MMSDDMHARQRPQNDHGPPARAPRPRREPKPCRVAGCENDTRSFGYVNGACGPCAREAIQEYDERVRRLSGCGGNSHEWEHFEDRVRCANCGAYAGPATLARMDADALAANRRELATATERGDKWAGGFEDATPSERTGLALGYRRGWMDRAARLVLALVVLAGCAPALSDARQADAERAYTCDPAGSWPEGPPAWRYPCERIER